MRNTAMLSMVALYAVACASSAPAPKVLPTAAAAPKVSSQIDADEYRRELEAAYAQIVARANDKVPANAPAVDLEAAASIPIPQHRTIDAAVRLFSVDMKDSIQTSLIRSARYKKLIDKALADQNLPKGLAYLPVIESAYVPTLTSTAGAHGIWQFMPETAREYGLRVDWWVDERADPERSTRAAAAYLKDLYRMFDDWALTVAAYNCGPGRVKRSLAENGATTFWELQENAALPKETRGYVPTFFATLLIASDPQTYGFTLGKATDLDEKRVDVRGPVSLQYISEAVGVDPEVLRALNPSLRRGVVPPGRASVVVPSKAAETLAARADTLRQEDAYVQFCSFTLRDGDNVKRLARKLGTTPETLLAINDLDEAARVGAGDTIYVPVRARELGALLAHSDDEEFYYAVRKGDTLYSIAKKNGLSVAELRELNDLSKSATIHKGQRLRVSAPRTLTAGGM
ncbi:MAG: transglycosylase SLT domain-containing protein [Acidobacteria bacterium]|nr:transglycosylase SLT domain-containing protein [Acidobacteriota bacterium]MBV9478262.1 transglycosylase SLT domain-containing protein [Acidobacteriota bacterium]